MRPVTTDPVRAGRESLARHGRSFDLAGAFLPAARRDDAAVLYGFCRLVDDLADTGADGADADLHELAREIRGARPARPLVTEVRRVIGPDVGPALELIAGVRGDLGVVRIADDAALLRYAYRVAGTVGLMMCRVLRAERGGEPFAIDLGVAMQITNICRDVAADAAIGRVYLPRTRLAAAGTSAEALLAGRADRGAIARVVLDLLDVADRYYASADRGMPFLPMRSRLAILVAARVYRAIGVALRRRAGDALSGRVVVPAIGKAWWTLAAIAAWVQVAGRSAGDHDPGLHVPLRGLPGAHA